MEPKVSSRQAESHYLSICIIKCSQTKNSGNQCVRHSTQVRQYRCHKRFGILGKEVYCPGVLDGHTQILKASWINNNLETNSNSRLPQNWRNENSILIDYIFNRENQSTPSVQARSVKYPKHSDFGRSQQLLTPNIFQMSVFKSSSTRLKPKFFQTA